jgi:hypothetical protein
VDLYASHERLVRYISDQGTKARDSRQVAQRLRQLLPDRIEGMRRNLQHAGESPSVARRRALVSGEFNEIITEIIELYGTALAARVEYETHLMLIDARRTLRRLKDRRS